MVTLRILNKSIRPSQVFQFIKSMSTMFTVNNKQISHKDLNTVRDFFTDDQWDLIDYALSEYQDHDHATEKCKETLDVISQLFRSSY